MHWEQEVDGWIRFIFPMSSSVPGTERVQCPLVELNFLNQQVFINLLLWAQWALGSVLHKGSVS